MSVLGVSAMAVTLLVAVLHVYFLVLEMFLWTKPVSYTHLTLPTKA